MILTKLRHFKYHSNLPGSISFRGNVIFLSPFALRLAPCALRHYPDRNPRRTTLSGKSTIYGWKRVEGFRYAMKRHYEETFEWEALYQKDTKNL
jgi:hypothetical protein